MGIKIEDYSHNRGLEVLKEQHSEELKEVEKINSKYLYEYKPELHQQIFWQLYPN